MLSASNIAMVESLLKTFGNPSSLVKLIKLGTLDFHSTIEGNFIMRKLSAMSLFRSTMCRMVPIQIILVFKQIIYILPLWVIMDKQYII